MHADFSVAAKRARTRIPVPPLNMQFVRERSQYTGLRARLRSVLISSAFAVGAIGTAAAFAANAGGVRVWVLGGKATVAVHSFAMTYQPTVSDLRRITASATFPVVLPVGVPSGSHIAWIAYAPSDHPNFITITYTNTSRKSQVGVSIVASAAIDRDAASAPANAGRITGPAYQWKVGKETVLINRRSSLAAVVPRIKDAMAAADPQSSLQANAAFASRIINLTRRPGFAVRYAPAAGRSVLLGAVELRRVPELARDGKPMPDTRTFYATNVPAAHGKPDYSKATVRWSTATVISAQGVRAIDAVMRATATNATCKCEILFHQASAAAYRVWKIDLAAPGRAQKYSVDAKSLKVTRLGA